MDADRVGAHKLTSKNKEYRVMDNEIENTAQTPILLDRQKVRMAYTLNDHQPVACTIISEQPFFYMDEECDFDAEEALMEEGLYDVALDEEIRALQSKMARYERLSSEFTQSSNVLDEFIENFTEPNREPKEILASITQTLSESRYAQSLLEFAQGNNVNIALSKQVETAFYDKAAKTIFIRQELNHVDQVLLSVQELRRHWQHKHDADKHPLTFHPDHAVLINRTQLADLSVAIVRTAWELQLQNKKDYWVRIEHSSMADLGRALAREALDDFRTLNNGKASAAIFETWFLSERCCQQDKKLINTMLADYRGYGFDTAQTSERVSIELISALGEQSFGKNYLNEHAQTILHDPLFTEARDRSNANFLWFIKFERSFLEAEQELQPRELINMSGIDQADNQKMHEDIHNETNTSNICEYDRSNGDNIIHIAFGSSSDNTLENILT